MKNENPNLFSYSDYRQYLKDFIQTKKKSDNKYSYRYYSARAGFSSTNFLSLVVKGRRNLTSSSIGKIAKGLCLNKNERAFFEDLVFMNQAMNHEEKDYYYQRMLKAKPFSEMKKIDKSLYDYFSKWYYPVVREIVEFVRPLDPEQVADILRPKITTNQVQSAIQLLLSLGLIEEVGTNVYQKREQVITTGSEIKSLQVANFHKQMISLAEKAIGSFPSNQRDISGMVLSINGKSMRKIKKKIESFRNELAHLAQNDPGENQVVYVQIHAFPLTKPWEVK